MNEILSGLLAIIVFGAGFLGKWGWDYFTGRVVEADKRSNEALRERVDIIGSEIKSRLHSLETRFAEVERSVSEFKTETQLALKSQRKLAHDIYEGIKAVIIKADEINVKTAEKVNTMDEKLMEWLKTHGRS